MSKKQQEDFAKMVVDHPEFKEVMTRVDMRLFNKFRTATPQEREIINAIMDSGLMFVRELRAIADGAEDLEPEEEKS